MYAGSIGSWVFFHGRRDAISLKDIPAPRFTRLADHATSAFRRLRTTANLIGRKSKPEDAGASLVILCDKTWNIAEKDLDAAEVAEVAEDGAPFIAISWADREAPDFADFQLVIAEIPNDPRLVETFADDFSQLEIEGGTLIWLFTPNSSREVASEVLSTRCFLQRHPKAITSVKKGSPFATLLEGREYRALFEPPEGVTSIAFGKTHKQLVAAYIDEREYPTVRIVMPATDPLVGDITRLIQAADANKKRIAPSARAARGVVSAAWIMIAASAVFMWCARYQQVWQPTSSAGQLAQLVAKGETTDWINAQLSDPKSVSAALAGDNGPSDQLHYLSVFDSRKQIDEVASNLSQESCDVKKRAYRRLESEGWQYLELAWLDRSSVLLRSMIKGVNESPECDFVPSFTLELSAAQQALNLMTVTYSWQNPKIFSTLMSHIQDGSRGDRESDDRMSTSEMSEAAAAGGSLSANIRYAQMADLDRQVRRGSAKDSLAQIEAGWRSLAASKDAIQGKVALAAAFNATQIKLLGLAVTKSDVASRAIRTAAVNELTEFIEANPSSNLTDDALLLAARLSIGNRDTAHAAQLLRTLMNGYPLTDSAAELRIRIEDALRRNAECTSMSCQQLAARLLSAAKSESPQNLHTKDHSDPSLDSLVSRWSHQANDHLQSPGLALCQLLGVSHVKRAVFR